MILKSLLSSICKIIGIMFKPSKPIFNYPIPTPIIIFFPPYNTFVYGANIKETTHRPMNGILGNIKFKKVKILS